jgi:WhiB family transcriptional regulator, redox-sensing transcriptional regulator
MSGMPVRSAWLEQAACATADSGLFFGQQGEGPRERHRREAAAKAICARCPVRKACAADALARQEPRGVWGGLTESERKVLRLMGARLNVAGREEVSHTPPT